MLRSSCCKLGILLAVLLSSGIASAQEDVALAEGDVALAEGDVALAEGDVAPHESLLNDPAVEGESSTRAESVTEGVPHERAPTLAATVAPDEELVLAPRGRLRRKRGRLNAGHLFLNAFVGDLVGAAAGGLVSLIFSGALGCHNDESGWLGGFTCSAGFLYGVAIGALYGAALGGPLGVIRAGGAAGAGGDPGMALLAGLLGAVAGTITVGLLTEVTQNPTAALAGGGGVGLLISTLGAVLLYDGSRPGPSRGTEGDAELAATPLVLLPGVSLELGGALFSLAGTWP